MQDLMQGLVHMATLLGIRDQQLRLLQMMLARAVGQRAAAERECAELRRKLDTQMAVIQESDAESLEVIGNIRAAFEELDGNLGAGVQAQQRERLRKLLGCSHG